MWGVGDMQVDNAEENTEENAEENCMREAAEALLGLTTPERGGRRRNTRSRK